MPIWTPDFPERKPRKYDPRIDPFSYEKELQEWLRRACRDLGLLYYHTHNSKHSPAGKPDAEISRPPTWSSGPLLVVAELKTPWNPNPTDKQREWMGAYRLIADALNPDGEGSPEPSAKIMEVYLWTHEDLDEIRDVLSLLSRRRPPTSGAA